MKKNRYPSVVYSIMMLAGLLVGLVSCKKTEGPSEPARIFKPSAVKIVSGETSAKLTWTAPILSAGAKLAYTIDFSTDSLFSSIKYSTTSDTAGVKVTDENIRVRTKYFARIKANATSTQPESKYIVSSSFQISGTQLFRPVIETEIKETSVTLRYTQTSGLSSIVLTPSTGNPITTTLTAADAGFKVISGLHAGTKYSAELFLGSKSVGFLSFTTPAATTYAVVLSPGDDISAAVATAADNAVIGLNDGTYNVPLGITLSGKTITLKSLSDNPDATIVNFKGFTLLGTGAGIKVAGINLNGTANSATYFADLTSASSNAAAANFTTITVDNCYIHGIGTGLIRGDRSSSYTIGAISFRNSLVYDITGSSSYYAFHLDKLVFASLTVNQCTFYNITPGLLNCKTTLSAAIPNISFTSSTFNNFGFNSLYVVMNASANPVNFTMKDCILANTPRSGTVLGVILSTGTGSSGSFTFNNYFNLKATVGGTDLTIPSTINQTANQTINLGWTIDRTTFELPVGSALRTASSTGGAIGDPRWTY
ncbi:DUF4957 domain-containing protein [Pedobacter sp. HMWF019]|uniref:DUF4957 domain-containing protein n=1 Tax=Pedobacter sp. HMWF019 TaxID=2056856 RepID=UPI001304D73A|nr:DUF4957 domain-containing protein [Pedobacter sp. HMWF019]